MIQGRQGHTASLKAGRYCNDTRAGKDIPRASKLGGVALIQGRARAYPAPQNWEVLQ